MNSASADHKSILHFLFMIQGCLPESLSVVAGYNGRYGKKMTRQLTAIIEREDDMYVALCPELDIVSQGEGVEKARANLIEALELFLESADPNEITRRLHTEVL